MTLTVLRMTMLLSLARYYDLYVGKDDAESDGSNEVEVPLHLSRGHEMPANDGERNRDSGIEEGEDVDIAEF